MNRYDRATRTTFNMSTRTQRR